MKSKSSHLCSHDKNSFAHNLHILHVKIRQQIVTYRSIALRERIQEFSVRDMAMVQICPSWICSSPSCSIYRSLHVGPYMFLQESGANIYELNISRDLGVRPIFDSADLTQYYTPMSSPTIIVRSLSFSAADAQFFFFSYFTITQTTDI